MREANLATDAARWKEENSDPSYILRGSRLDNAIAFLETKRGKKADGIIRDLVEKSKEVVDKEVEEMRCQFENKKSELMRQLSADLASDLTNWERNGQKDCNLLQGDRLENASSFAAVLEPRIKEFVAKSQAKARDVENEAIKSKLDEFMSSLFPKGADE
jgi:hypothetical protein